MEAAARHTDNTATYMSGEMSAWRPEDHIPPEIVASLRESARSSGSGSSDDHSRNPLLFFHILQSLKLQKRTGWLNNGIPPALAESISDHMHRMSLMALLLRTPGVDTLKCMRIAAVHDVAEALVGDITPLDTSVSKQEKHRRELAAIQYLCDSVIRPYNAAAATEILDRWLDYEDQRCLEAVYAKDLDKYEMLVQCFEYEKQSHSDAGHRGIPTRRDLSQFYRCVPEITTEEVATWCRHLLDERARFLEGIAEK